MPSGARHPAHPVELGAVEIVGACYFGIARIYSLLPLLEIVAVVAFIRVDGVVVQLHNDGTDTIEEISVVRHHQQR